jgi:hypothetical protein
MRKRTPRNLLNGLALSVAPAWADSDQTYEIDNLVANPAAFTRATAIEAIIRKTDHGLMLRQSACGWTCPNPVYLTLPAKPASVPGGKAFAACLAKAWAGGDDFDGYIKVRIIWAGTPRKMTGLVLTAALQGGLVHPATNVQFYDCPG